jgi:hypothetical protein
MLGRLAAAGKIRIVAGGTSPGEATSHQHTLPDLKDLGWRVITIIGPSAQRFPIS